MDYRPSSFPSTAQAKSSLSKIVMRSRAATEEVDGAHICEQDEMLPKQPLIDSSKASVVLPLHLPKDRVQYMAKVDESPFLNAACWSVGVIPQVNYRDETKKEVLDVLDRPWTGSDALLKSVRSSFWIPRDAPSKASRSS